MSPKHFIRFCFKWGVILAAYLVGGGTAPTQVIFSGNATDNGVSLTPGGYSDPYIANGIIAIGATGSGGLSLPSTTLFGYGRSLAFGTGIAGCNYSFAINGNILQITATAISGQATWAAICGVFALGLAAWRHRRTGPSVLERL